MNLISQPGEKVDKEEERNEEITYTSYIGYCFGDTSN